MDLAVLFHLPVLVVLVLDCTSVPSLCKLDAKLQIVAHTALRSTSHGIRSCRPYPRASKVKELARLSPLLDYTNTHRLPAQRLSELRGDHAGKPSV